MQCLLVATHNRHKIEEIRSILGPGIAVVGAHSLGIVLEPEETGTTFAENARIKALAWQQWLMASPSQGQSIDAVLADDSGLEVDALAGAPGVLSARFAATPGQRGNSTDADNNAKLLQAMAGVSDEKRTARFRCVLSLLPVQTDGNESETGWFFEGHCEGRIAREAVGDGGFGYGPLFIPDGFESSLAIVGQAVKNRLSHRAIALRKLCQFLDQQKKTG